MIEYTKTRSIHGRAAVRAKLGAFESSGGTKAEATEKLLAEVSRVPTDMRPHLEIKPDGAWLMYWDMSWCYRMPSGSLAIIAGDRAHVLQMMLNHIQDYYQQ